MSRPETKVEDVLYEGIQDLAGLCIKLPSLWYTGIPDRLVLLEGGRAFFIETKARTGRWGRNQKWWADTLRRLGFNYRALWTVREVEQFLSSL